MTTCALDTVHLHATGEVLTASATGTLCGRSGGRSTRLVAEVTCPHCVGAFMGDGPEPAEAPEAVVPVASDVAAVFERVYTQHHGRLVRWFFYRIEDWATAEDLTSELFETLWRDMTAGRVALDEAGHVAGYLTARARFLRMAHYRRAAVRRELAWGSGQGELDKGQAEARAAVDGPEHTVLEKVDTRALLATLPPKRRVAVGLRYLDDFSLETIAAVAGVNVSVITETITLGLRTLRAAVGVQENTDRARGAAERREAMRAAYTASLAEGKPLSMQELGRRFGRTGTIAKRAVIDLLPEPAATRTKRPSKMARARLLADLTDGLYPPDRPLNPAELAELYGVNGSYVRRLLPQLAETGLLAKQTHSYYPAQRDTECATVTDLDQHRATRRGVVPAGLGSLPPLGVAA